MSGKTIAIDASVVLKWWLRDEEATAEADKLQDDFLNGKLKLIAPALLDYEVANVLKVAVVRNRIDEADALTAITDLTNYNIDRFDIRPHQQSAFRLACQYQRSVYDASYVILAQAHGVELYTGDKRLFNAVTNALTWVKWVGDYRS